MKSSYHVPPDGDLKENTADEVLNFSLFSLSLSNLKKH